MRGHVEHCIHPTRIMAGYFDKRVVIFTDCAIMRNHSIIRLCLVHANMCTCMHMYPNIRVACMVNISTLEISLYEHSMSTLTAAVYDTGCCDSR